MSTAEIFSIDHIGPSRHDLAGLPPLESVGLDFHLPTFPESASSVNRLLESLKLASSPKRSVNGTGVSPKGKEREIMSESPTAEDGVDEGYDLWMRASEMEPGPSKGRTFQVSRTFIQERCMLGD